MATAFRKHQGRFEDWHFHEDCPDWPEANYIEQRDIPPANELCTDCEHLRDSGNPKPNPGPGSRPQP